MRFDPNGQFVWFQGAELVSCSRQKRLHILSSLVDILRDQDNHRRGYRPRQIVEQNLRARIDRIFIFLDLSSAFQLVEIFDANDAPPGHEWQLLGCGNGRIYLVRRKIKRRIVEFPQQRTLQGRFSDCIHSLVA